MARYVELFPELLFRSRKQAGFRVLVISNCQAQYLAPFLEFALADCSCDYLICHQIPGRHAAIDAYLDETRNDYQLVLSLSLEANWHAISRDALLARFGADRLFFLINMYFGGLFPDETRLGVTAETAVMSPMGGPHSKIALGGWVAGLSLPEILKLYTPETMEKIGFLEMFKESEDQLRAREESCDSDFAVELVELARSTFGFYTINHPTPTMIANYVNHVRHRLVVRGQARSSGLGLSGVLATDTLLKNGWWPIYPELRSILKSPHIASDYFILPEGANAEIISREIFVRRSMAIYERLKREDFIEVRQAAEALTLIKKVIN